MITLEPAPSPAIPPAPVEARHGSERPFVLAPRIRVTWNDGPGGDWADYDPQTAAVWWGASGHPPTDATPLSTLAILQQGEDPRTVWVRCNGAWREGMAESKVEGLERRIAVLEEAQRRAAVPPPAPTGAGGFLTCRADHGGSMDLSMPFTVDGGGDLVLRIERREDDTYTIRVGNDWTGGVEVVAAAIRRWHRAWGYDALPAGWEGPSEGPPGSVADLAHQARRFAAYHFGPWTPGESPLRGLAELRAAFAAGLEPSAFWAGLPALAAAVAPMTGGEWRSSVSDLSGNETLLTEDHTVLATLQATAQALVDARGIAALRNAAPEILRVLAAIGGGQ